MKFIHTSDWHLGKSIHEVQLLNEQKELLYQLINLVDAEKPDAIIISGDIYDRAIPGREALMLFDMFLNEAIIKRKIPVLCITGNHDSERLEFASSLLSQQGFYISGKLKKDLAKITLNDNYGPVNFYLIPFAYASEMRDIIDSEEVKNYDDAYRVLMERICSNIAKDERNVLIVHGYFVDITSDFEQSDIIDDSVRPLSVGTTEYVNVNYFDEFDYVAMGHIHKPLKVKSERIRYSGSLMKYSFSETQDNKGVVIVEIGEKGNITTRHHSLKPKRDMVKIEGSFKQLMEGPNNDNYLMAVLTDENPIFDAISHLRTVYPNILRIEYKMREEKEDKVVKKEMINKKSDLDLFQLFYKDMTGIELDDEQIEIVQQVFDHISQERGDDK